MKVQSILLKTMAVVVGMAVAGCATTSPDPNAHVAEQQKYRLYDPAIALVLAKASTAVYEQDPCASFQAALGEPLAGECDWSDRAVEKAPFRAALFDYRGDVILAFQGTVPADRRTLLADANYLPTPLMDDPATVVHGGFLLSWLYVKPWVEAKARERLATGRRIWITGHSLGGAQAQLAAHHFRRSIDPSRIAGVYTFAAPRVGQRHFERAISESQLAEKMFRLENDHDLVPLMPAQADFVPVGQCVFIDESNIVQPCAGGRRLSELLGDPDTWRSFAAAAAHKIASYSAALGSECNKFPSWVPVPRREECIPLALRPPEAPSAAQLVAP